MGNGSKRGPDVKGSGIKKRGSDVSVAGGKSRPSFFPQGPRTTPGAYRPQLDQTEMDYRANSVEHQKWATKTQLLHCLERELERCEEKIATYQGVISRMERVKSQMDRSKIAQEGDPFKIGIKIYQALIESYTLQEKSIKEHIKTAKTIDAK